MEKKDYFEARMWYAEGLDNCDLYSINRLTRIWVDQPDMRRTMNNVISRCFVCLKSLSSTNDNTDAMRLLADYYYQGIGMKVDSVQATNLMNEVAKILHLPPRSTVAEISTNEPDTLSQNRSASSKNTSIFNRLLLMNFIKQYHFFLAYTYSPTMPYGVSVGGFKKFGLSLNFRTSNNSKNATYQSNTDGLILGIEKERTYFFEEKDEIWSSWMITGDALIPVFTKNLFISAGGGYAQREYYCPVVFTKDNASAWCYNPQASYRGIALEVGGVYKYKKMLFAGGINTIRFRDLDAFVSVGFSF
ncbi:MAG: hypothetical protein LBR67_09280 [Dysgonamonadaceae bacterium]|jgi:hypothetical protein|nr:hypothetical protein [Dysgonamonadaceae bacterium]